MQELWHDHKLALFLLPFCAVCCVILVLACTVKGVGLDAPLKQVERNDPVRSRTTVLLIYRRHSRVTRSTVPFRNTNFRHVNSRTRRSGGFGFGK